GGRVRRGPGSGATSQNRGGGSAPRRSKRATPGGDAPPVASAPLPVGGIWADRSARAVGRVALRHPGRRRARLDRRPRTGQCPRSGRACGMKLLSHLSPEGDGLPEPADARRFALGLEAWNAALDPEDGANSSAAQGWSATPLGKRLLASIFGNSPFLSGV